MAQVGEVQRLSANTWKKERVPQTWLAATRPGAGTLALFPWKRPHLPRPVTSGAQFTPRLQPGGSIERLDIRALIMPSAR